jgi:peptidoglycan/xylan/chitin deacetylase (PgdA/CDA1 family)
MDKVREGVSRGLFELGIHGWNHTDYRNLTQKEQRDSLEMAIKKMKLLFGKESKIFIPPGGEFNNDTIEAMNQLGLRIISGGMWVEENFDQGKSIFNATNRVQEDDSLHQQIYHLPATVSLKGYDNGKWIKNSIENIVNNATDSIDKYGYAIIVIHPQDLLKIENGEFVDILITNEIKDLSMLIDSILSRGVDIVSFSKVVGIDANE